MSPRCSITLSLLVALAISAPGIASAADRGMQFVGASRTSAADIQAAAQAFRAAGGRTQISLLPYEFNPQAPFANATSFVQQALPGMDGRLTVAICVGWFPHDARGLAEQRAFWNAWRTSSPSPGQQALRATYLDRLRVADGWINGMLQWARERQLVDRLHFVIVPVLEDTCPESHRAAYQRLVDATRALQAADGVSRTSLRRSPLPENIFRIPGVALELHGPWRAVRNTLESGDAWSNDGSPYQSADFVHDAGDALDRGVSVLLWRDRYNGTPKGNGFERNWAQRTVAPFTGDGGAGELNFLKRVLRVR